MSKHSVTIRGLRVLTTCWSWAWSYRTSPSKWVGLGSPLEACSVYGDLTCSVHTVNNLCMFNCQCNFHLCNRGPYVRLAFVPKMLSSWNKDILIIIIINEYTDSVPGKHSHHFWFTVGQRTCGGNQCPGSMPSVPPLVYNAVQIRHRVSNGHWQTEL